MTLMVSATAAAGGSKPTPVYAGRVTSTGGLVSSPLTSTWTASRTSTGRFTVRYNATIPNAVPVLTIRDAGGDANHYINIDNFDNVGFDVIMTSNRGTLIDKEFDFIVYTNDASSEALPRLASGAVKSDGVAITLPAGWSSALSGENFNVTFPAAKSNYAVVVTTERQNDQTETVRTSVYSRSSTGFTVRATSQSNNARFEAFNFLVIDLAAEEALSAPVFGGTVAPSGQNPVTSLPSTWFVNSASTGEYLVNFGDDTIPAQSLIGTPVNANAINDNAQNPLYHTLSSDAGTFRSKLLRQETSDSSSPFDFIIVDISV